jgi:endonuclease/exonuclease/phosphatase family metal-dependent hydrolase
MFIAFIVFFFWGSSPAYNQEAYQTYRYDDADLPKSKLKVMTYNLGYLSGMKNNLPEDMPYDLFQNNLRRCRQLLDSLDPDIIGFQEIDFASARSHHQNQLDSLSAGYHQAYASVNWNKRYVPFPYWPPRYHFGKMLSGQAILSKYPISKTETKVLKKPVNAPFYYNAFYLDRLVQMAVIEVGERKLMIMNLHLEAFDAETRESQAITVRNLYEQYARTMPVILMGDFNSTPYWTPEADNAMRTILGAEHIACAVSRSRYDARPEAYYTFSSGQPGQRIDYVLYNDNYIKPVSARTVKEAGEISDHLPVIFEFVFQR